MEVNNISPTPKSTACLAHWVVNVFVFSLPPFKYTYQFPSASNLVSMAKTIHWLPKFFANRLINEGAKNAAVLIDILSAPFCNKTLTSSSVLMPPPTVNGMLMWWAILLTSALNVLRFSIVAVMSKKTNSSAPACAYKAPSSMGSPASRNCSKLTPFTVRPSLMSKQGMMRLVNMVLIEIS